MAHLIGKKPSGHWSHGKRLWLHESSNKQIMEQTNLLYQCADKLFMSVIHVVERSEDCSGSEIAADRMLLSQAIALVEQYLFSMEEQEPAEPAKICFARLKEAAKRGHVCAQEVLDMIFSLQKNNDANGAGFLTIEGILSSVGLSPAWGAQLKSNFSREYPVFASDRIAMAGADGCD